MIDISIVLSIAILIGVSFTICTSALIWVCQPGEPERRRTAPGRKRCLKVYMPISCVVSIITVGVITGLIVFLIDPVALAMKSAYIP